MNDKEIKVPRRTLTADQMRRAKQKLAQDRGIGPESITNDAVLAALDLGTVITYAGICGTQSYDSGSTGGYNYSETSSSYDTGGASYSGDSG